jgi:NAD(P)-dependent dehydrogenase (short-subunit alcohol dehydrogenase family)
VVSNYFDGLVAVITGAGSGIGQALAIELAQRGARLALSDVRSPAAEETARRCRAYGAEVQVHHLDVTVWDAVSAYAEEVSALYGGADLVFCVAGIIISGSFLNSRIEDIDDLIDVNVRGVLYTAKAFLPHLFKSKHAHLVTVSSAFGLLATPNFSAYSASKFAVRGLSESLQQEMAIQGHRVSVTCAYPGGVRTPIVRNGRFAPGEDRSAIVAGFEERIARTDPDRAAHTILRAAERRRLRVLVGGDARVVSLTVNIVGSQYARLVPRIWRLMKILEAHRNRPDRQIGD